MSQISVTIVTLLLLGDFAHSRACSPRHQQDFTAVAAADRLEVRDLLARPLLTIDDPQKIKTAITFIQEHSDDWSEVAAGPQAPELQLEFFHQTKHLNGFGVARAYLAIGALSRPTPPEQIETLMRELELQWPKY